MSMRGTEKSDRSGSPSTSQSTLMMVELTSSYTFQKRRRNVAPHEKPE